MCDIDCHSVKLVVCAVVRLCSGAPHDLSTHVLEKSHRVEQVKLDQSSAVHNAAPKSEHTSWGVMLCMHVHKSNHAMLLMYTAVSLEGIKLWQR
jgi:hypothetical protein